MISRYPVFIAGVFAVALSLAGLPGMESAKATQAEADAVDAAWRNCTDAADHRDVSNGTHYACCSITLKTCIVCKAGGTYADCKTVPYRTNPLPKRGVADPGVKKPLSESP